MKNEKTTKNFTIWKCPYCKHIIHDAEYQSFRYNIGCPQCGCPLAKFKKKIINFTWHFEVNFILYWNAIYFKQLGFIKWLRQTAKDN